MTPPRESNRDQHLAKGQRLGASPSYLDKHGGRRQVAVWQTYLAARGFSTHRSNPSARNVECRRLAGRTCRGSDWHSQPTTSNTNDGHCDDLENIYGKLAAELPENSDDSERFLLDETVSPPAPAESVCDRLLVQQRCTSGFRDVVETI